MLRKKHIHSSRVEQKRRRAFVMKVVGFCAVIALCVSGIVYLGYASFLTVDSVQVVGASSVSVDALTEVAERATDGKRFFIFPKVNTFFFPKDTVEEQLLTAFHRLASVDVSRNSLTSVTVSVKEREAAYIWCIDRNTDSCFFMDIRGYIFDTAPLFSASPYFVFYGALAPQPIGMHALSEEEISYIISFKDAVTSVISYVGEPQSLLVKGPEDFELNVKNGPRIFFDIDDPVEIVVENIRLAIEEGGIKERLLELEYIDARFGNKIFFK